MAEEKYLTAQGAEELQQELDELITVKRPALAALLKEAISQGDLSENADYHDAKEQQAFLEGRIQYLENLLHHAIIIDEDTTNAPLNEVQVGSAVTIHGDGEMDEETYRIVGAAEADPRNGKISHESPIGAALLGRAVGDKVHVQTPGGTWTVTIKSIER